MAHVAVSEYQQQAIDFLDKWGMTFSVVLVGNDCPRFCSDATKGIAMDQVNTFPRRTHIHGKHYRCTITRVTGPVVTGSFVRPQQVAFDFWNSYAYEEQNAIVGAGIQSWHIPQMNRENAALAMKYKGKRKTQVTAYDLLACITGSDPGDFEQFCGDFGYDTDSRKAESAFRAVIAEWKKVERFFTAEELEELQAIS